MSSHRNTLSCPHDTPPGPDHTCPHSYHVGYSESNLPPMLFGLDKLYPAHLPTVGNLMENGREVVDWQGNAVVDYEFLPRYIATRPPAWLLEYWARTDSRLTYKDIKARMTANPRNRPSENTLNMRREREVRGPLGLSCWNRRRGMITRVEVERVERWSLEQISYNTAMTVEYDGDGEPLQLRSKALVQNGPSAGMSATSVGQATFPLNTFLAAGHPNHTPSDRLTQALSLYGALTQKAKDLGISSWQFLPVEHLPRGWSQVSSVNRFTYEYFNNLEDDEGEDQD